MLRAGDSGGRTALPIWIDVMDADGAVIRATPASNSDLFRRTAGGMGRA